MSEQLSTRALVKQYLNICNAGFRRQEVEFPLSEVMALANQLISGETLTLEVVDDQERPLGHFTTRFVEGQFTPIQETEHPQGLPFTLSRSYLEKVVENADHYIHHPGKLDWNWLTARLKAL